jgi:type I restriction enzyme M protein
MKCRTDENLKEFRRDLRRGMTEAEKILWNYLRDRRFTKMKFRRQHPVLGRFVVDFYCPEKKLAIELDGFVHEGREEIDADRQSFIEAHGIRVIRFKNEEVIYALRNVLDALTQTFSLLDGSPHPNPLPLNGRGNSNLPSPFQREKVSRVSRDG